MCDSPDRVFAMSGLISRNATEIAAEILSAFPALTIDGARQVGKSTFAAMLADQHDDAQIVTLDDGAARDFARIDPEGFVNQNETGLLVIDEIQRAPDLLLPIKAAIDRARRPARFILTGSADLLRLERTPDSLAGRAISLRLHGLSQGEANGRREGFVDWFLRATSSEPAAFTTPTTRDDYIRILAAGSYPELRRLSARLRDQWLESYLQRIVQLDARDVRQRVEPTRMVSILRLLAANQSGELVKKRIADAADLPASTVTGYLDTLQTLFLTDNLPPWTPNLTSREIGRPKVTIPDSALAMHLTQISPADLQPLIDNNHLGPLAEGLVVAELRKQQTWSNSRYRMFHYRDRDKVEVDLIIELPDRRILGVEVKAGRTYKAEHFKGLRFLADKLGDQFAGGFVLGTADHGVQIGQRLWGLPIAALWEL